MDRSRARDDSHKMEICEPREAVVTRLAQLLASWAAELRRAEGQTMAEYAVVLGVLIVGVAASVVLFATSVHTLLQTSIISLLNNL
jgi:Flp pilus assembly pilin Flp